MKRDPLSSTPVSVMQSHWRRTRSGSALLLALNSQGACLPSHDDAGPDTSLGAQASGDRIRLLVDRDHRRNASVVPVVIEARRVLVTQNPHCVAIIGFPGRLDTPLGSDCPPAAADAGTETHVCMDLRRLGSDSTFEGTRIAAYHPAEAAETFTAFAQLHDNANCTGSPLAEVAVVVEIGSEPAPAPDPSPTTDAGVIEDAGTDASVDDDDDEPGDGGLDAGS